MLEVFFSVKAEIQQGQQLRIVGSPTELGEWDPNKAMPLIKKKGFWECGPVETQEEQRFEFKVIKIKTNGQIEWESLPQNSNRKFRPRQSTKLIIEWSKNQGRAESFRPKNGSKNDQGSLKSFNSISSPTIKRKFNPYETAADDISSSEEEDEEDFSLEKQNQNELNAYDNEFEQIYYRSNAFEIFCGLTKKVKIFVISKEIDLKNSFHFSVMQSMKNLPRSYHIKWITMESLSGRRRSFCTSQLTVSTFFEIQEEQIHFKSLQGSFFVLIDLESALIFSQKVKNKNFGIYLPSKHYQACIKAIPELGCEAKWIMFDQNSSNQIFFEHLLKNPRQSIEIEHLKQLHINGPKLQHLVQTVVHHEEDNDIIISPSCVLSESEAFPFFTEDNSITILQGGLVDRYNQFVQELLLNKKQKSVIVVICKQNHLHSLVSALRKVNNVVIIYDNFRSVIFDNEEYQPLKRLEQILQLFRMKVKLYKDNIGGEIVEKNSSISYYLPMDKEDIAEKIYNDYKLIASKYSFLRIIKKGRKVKVSWSLAEEARTIRTICEIKYSNFGSLGNFNIISDCLSLRELKDDLKLITEHYERLFQKGDLTDIRYYSYGGRKKSPTCYVTPRCSAQ